MVTEPGARSPAVPREPPLLLTPTGSPESHCSDEKLTHRHGPGNHSLPWLHRCAETAPFPTSPDDSTVLPYSSAPKHPDLTAAFHTRCHSSRWHHPCSSPLRRPSSIRSTWPWSGNQPGIGFQVDCQLVHSRLYTLCQHTTNRLRRCTHKRGLTPQLTLIRADFH